MNVLHLINYAGGGGSEKYIEILKEHLEDINVSLACNEEGKLSDKFKEEGLPVYHVEMLRPFDFKAAKKLAKICNDNEIDIIHSHYLRENYISILSKMFYHNKAKIVYTCHFNNEDSFIVRTMNKIFYKKLDMIIAISKTVGDTLLKNGSPEDKIKVIYHGMPDTDKCAPQKEARDKFGVADDEFVISCGSRFSPEKGNEFLIRSIDKLNKKWILENDETTKGKKLKVLLANEGATLDECKKLANDLMLDKIIEFVGYQKSMEDLYLASDVYVTPSQSEGLGLATLEALNCGVPNVVTNIGGLTEIVNDETDCGFSVPYNDEDAMCDAIFKIITDEHLWKEFSNNGKKLIKETFSRKMMIENTMKVYENVYEGYYNE